MGGSHPDSEISYDFDSYATSITIDPSGNIFVTGETHSSDFPTTTGAYDTSYNGSGDEYSSDVFVSKLNSTLTTLLASTYLGGSFSDWANSMAIDSEGNVYVTGKANSLNFPTTTGAYDTSYNDYSDSFISKLSGDLTTLLASTYLGGLSIGNSIAVDSGGNIYVAGATSSKNFPTTTGAYDTSYNKDDAFVSKFDSNLSASSTTSSGISWPVDNFEKSKITTKGTSYRGSYGSPCTNKSMDPYEAGAGRHPGIDYPISTGTPIKAMADGIIDLTIKRNLDGSDPSKENKNGGWGGLVIIRHDQFGGVYSIYAHLSEYSKKLIKQKKPGKTEITVKKGDIIGKSGGTGPWKGNSDGNHLHFQIDRAGNKVVPWFPSKWPAWAKDKTPFKWWWKNKCHETSAVNIPDDWQRYDDNDESGSPYYSEKNKEHADYPKDENNYYESLGGQVLEYTYDPIQFIEDRL